MVKLIFLGTSNAIPSAKRNHTSIWIKRDEENILLDCGEGTQRQMRIANLSPFKITRILITHTHGDHVFGLPGLLATLSSGEYNKTLYIYGPKGIKSFIKNMISVFKLRLSFKLEVKEANKKFFESKDFYLESKKLYHGIPCNAYCLVEKQKLKIDKEKLKKYSIPSIPILKKLKQGKNIKYNGKKYSSKELTYIVPEKKISFVLDTRMNENIIKFVKDSDLLVCESTFEEKLKEKANEFFHLTSEQAAEIAKKSNSRKLILTHLSQRYENKENEILNEAKKIFKNTLIAHDFDKFEI